jgi:hypothetical protein
MSMIGNLRRASDEQITHLLKHPEEITEFLYGPEENKPSLWMIELDIYPTIWDRDPQEDDALGYLEEYYDPMRDFVAAASKENQGLIIYLN